MFYLQEEVMMYERVLLQTIKFDLQVEHPYPSILKFGKALKGIIIMPSSNDSLDSLCCKLSAVSY